MDPPVVAGQAAEVTGEIVDDLNAEHAAAAAAVSQADAAEHLRRSGAAISALIASLSADELAAGDGRVRLFAQIAIRHADNHRTDIETALAAQGLHRLTRAASMSRPSGRQPMPGLAAAAMRLRRDDRASIAGCTARPGSASAAADRLIRPCGPSRLPRMAIAAPTPG